MYLKKLRIKGFKSFPDPVEISFEPQITAIVGPNGSGKSNIVDAIRWALGEQSAKLLRGARMEDLIFSGSSSRKPQQIAEVFLTLDNSDYRLPIDQKEITIGRRLFRTGESDYIINNQVCRLKDIQDLIIDTGLGREAYSIIGQGKIDYLLSSRPQDRREVFEEAAGIMKYKQRKKEATRKLEKTEQDLIRIKDIINELENRLKPVANEAEKAKKYQKWYQDLKELEINLATMRLGEIDTDLFRWLAEAKNVKKQYEEKRLLLSECQNKVSKLEEEREQAADNLGEQKDKVFSIKTRIEQLKNKLALYQEKKRSSNENLKRIENSVQRQKERESECSSEAKCLSSQIDEQKEKIYNLKKEISSLEGQLQDIMQSIREKVSRKEAINNNFLDHMNDRAEIKNRLEIYREKTGEISKEIEEVEKERQNLNRKLDEVMDEEDQIREKLMVLHQEEGQLLLGKEEKEQNIEKLEEEIKDLRFSYDGKRDTLQQLSSHLKMLQRLQDQKEGYYQGVKEVLKCSKNGNLKGILGVVADLIEVENGYEQAIAAVLGSRLQNVVVEDSSSAKEAIDFLRRTKNGRATFMPLDLVQDRSLNSFEEEILSKDGILGVATGFIKYDSRISKAINNLLGRVIIAINKDAAIKAFRKINGKLLFVTIDGETVNPGGTITGGSINEKQLDILTRSRQIEEIKEKVSSMERELNSLEEAIITKNNSLLKEQKSLSGIEEGLRKNEMELLSCQKDLEGLEKNSDRLKEQISLLDEKFEKLYEKLGSLDVQIIELEQELELIGSDNRQHEEILSRINEEIKELEKRQEHLNNLMVEMRMKLVSAEEKYEHFSSERKRFDAERIKVQQRIKELLEEKKLQQETLTELDAKSMEVEEKLQQTVVELQEEEERLDVLRIEEQDLKSRYAQEGERLKDISKAVSTLEKKLNNLELKTTKITMEKEQIKERMREEYGVEIDNVKGTHCPEPQKAKKEIARLKKEIKKLGTINPGSIEEYEELNQRLDYLHKQHSDLDSARDYLYRIIEQMDEIMQTRFLETFKQVKEHFEQVFKKVFGGGKAELYLTDPGNLLETGVEISAQPPGKKLQKMSLMSGGEKALTAIALVFSLLQVKPSPFYILDEIDAPLDESNVDRFARFVREFSSAAQFILITHRKRSMAEADALYGVTMEDSGVSKIVSMKLAEQAVS